MGLLSNLINRVSGNTNTAATNTANKTASNTSSPSTAKTNTNTNTSSNKTLWQRISDWANTGNTNVDAAGYSYGSEGPSYVSPQVMNQTQRTTPKTIFPTSSNTGSQNTANTGNTSNTPSAPNYSAPNSYVWSDGRVHSYAEPTGAGTVDNTPSTPSVQGYTPGTAAPVNAAIVNPMASIGLGSDASKNALSDKILKDYNSSPNTNGLANTMSEKDFFNNDLMRETYGNYQNYKNGITVAQQQQQKANILGRLLGSNSDTTNAYSSESGLNKRPAFGGPVYESTKTNKDILNDILAWANLGPENTDAAGMSYDRSGEYNNIGVETPYLQDYIPRTARGLDHLIVPAPDISSASEARLADEASKNLETTQVNNGKVVNPKERKFEGINSKTGQPENGAKNPSGLYATSTDPKTGIWTDQFGNRWTSDGKEVLSNQEFNRGNMTEYNTGVQLPVTDANGNVVGSTYIDPVTGQPTNSPVAYNNYLGYLQDKSQVNSLGENPMADALSAVGVLPNSITNMYNTYNDYAPVLQTLADSGTLGAVPEDAIPNTGTNGVNPNGTPNGDTGNGTGGSPGGGGGGYYPGGGGGGTVPTGTADTLYSLPEVGNYASQLMLNKMMPTGYDYDYNKRLDSRIGDLQAAQNAYVQSSIPLIARTYQDQAANSFANLLNTLRANRASGLTSGASRGAQAAQDVQAVQSANKENASSLNNLVNTNLAAYLQTLAGKRATAGSDTAGELQSYYSPMATALGEILSQYNYGSAAAQVNNGGLQRAQSYLV